MSQVELQPPTFGTPISFFSRFVFGRYRISQMELLPTSIAKKQDWRANSDSVVWDWTLDDVFLTNRESANNSDDDDDDKNGRR
jgi:hypothetical protein